MEQNFYEDGKSEFKKAHVLIENLLLIDKLILMGIPAKLTKI